MSVKSDTPAPSHPRSTTTPATPNKPRNETLQLIICILGIYICYLRYGLLQERIYSARHGPDGDRFTYTLFLVAVQTATNALIALIVGSLPIFANQSSTKSTTSSTKSSVEDHSPQRAFGIVRGIPLLDYMIVSLSYLSAMVFSFTALNHMSYPMQALGKSCKMIPVMLMGIFIRGRRYSPREFLCVAIITLGVIMFSFKGGKSKSSVPTSSLGFVFLFASLFMDGVTGPLQERVVANFKPSTHQLMFWQNLCSVIWLSFALVITGEARDAITFITRFPETLTDVMLFSFVSAIGQNFIFYTVRNFSALIVTTITTTRKMFTVLLSIFVNKHPMAPRQWLGLALVFAAISWEAAAKQRAKAAKAAKAVKDSKDGLKQTDEVESKKDQ